VGACDRRFYKQLPENSIISLKAALIGFDQYKSRLQLINIVRDYKNIYLSQQDIRFERKYDMDSSGISFLAFKKNLKRSFPLKRWCLVLLRNGLRAVYRPMTHRNL
jgi:hypothetical protein